MHSRLNLFNLRCPIREGWYITLIAFVCAHKQLLLLIEDTRVDV